MWKNAKVAQKAGDDKTPRSTTTNRVTSSKQQLTNENRKETIL